MRQPDWPTRAIKLDHSIEIQFLFLSTSAVSLSLSAQPARFRFSELFEKATFVLFASAASIFSAPRTGLFMHVGRFLCQRGRGSLGSCLRLGIRIVCVIGARTVVAVIGAATGTFVAVVVGDGMVGARVFHIQMFTMRQTRALYALAGKTQRRCHTKSLGFQFHTLHPRIIRCQKIV